MVDKTPAAGKKEKNSNKVLVPILLVGALGLGGYGVYSALKGRGVDSDTIVGKVTDAITGAPIGGCAVSALALSETQIAGATTTTLADGTYALRGLGDAPGGWLVAFACSGYETAAAGVEKAGVELNMELVPTGTTPEGLTATLSWD